VGGHIVDPANNLDGPADLAVRDGRISEVGQLTTGARRAIDVAGHHVLPGVVDTHTQLSRHFGAAEGHRMVAAIGIVTALGPAGAFDDLVEVLWEGGAGLNVAYLHPLVPGQMVSSSAPPAAEIQ
jgi:predicted amidohydrolase